MVQYSWLAGHCGDWQIFCEHSDSGPRCFEQSRIQADSVAIYPCLLSNDFVCGLRLYDLESIFVKN